ncbi:MAG: hypothetical protein IJ184_06530 [Alphaproteobacteria bacterium]|nr:hypothetical protein [Alphaproteobacteria bacterium]
MMTKLGGILALIAIIALMLIFGGVAIYNKGYSAAETVYQRQANEAVLAKVDNTEKLEAEKEKLKEREKNLDANCKALYNTDLSACRRQLRGQH